MLSSATGMPPGCFVAAVHAGHVRQHTGNQVCTAARKAGVGSIAPAGAMQPAMLPVKRLHPVDRVQGAQEPSTVSSHSRHMIHRCRDKRLAEGQTAKGKLRRAVRRRNERLGCRLGSALLGCLRRVNYWETSYYIPRPLSIER